MRSVDLHRLLARSGSYRDIAAATASGQLDRLLPIELFEHVGIVDDRLERLTNAHEAPSLAELRLAVLVHEESPDSLPGPLAAAGVSDFAPTVVTVVSSFGELWKVEADLDIARYVSAHA